MSSRTPRQSNTILVALGAAPPPPPEAIPISFCLLNLAASQEGCRAAPEFVVNDEGELFEPPPDPKPVEAAEEEGFGFAKPSNGGRPKDVATADAVDPPRPLPTVPPPREKGGAPPRAPRVESVPPARDGGSVTSNF